MLIFACFVLVAVSFFWQNIQKPQLPFVAKNNVSWHSDKIICDRKFAKYSYCKYFCRRSKCGFVQAMWSLCQLTAMHIMQLRDLLLISGSVHPNPGPISGESTDTNILDDLRCAHCDLEFSRKDAMDRHMSSVHEEASKFVCDNCGAEFNRKDNLSRHKNRKRKCEPSADPKNVKRSLIQTNKQQTSADRSDPQEPSTSSRNSSEGPSFEQPISFSDDFSVETENIQITLIKHAFQKKLMNFAASYKTDVRDPLVGLSYLTDPLKGVINTALQIYTGVKLSICLIVELFKPTDPAKAPEVHHFWCYQKQIYRHGEIDLEQCYPKILSSIDKYMKEGSGWAIVKIRQADVTVAAYEPLAGRCYTELPIQLKNKHAILNIHNMDDKCFLWCVVAKLYPAKHDKNLVRSYFQNEAKINTDGVVFPMRLKQIPLFEKNNSVSINIYGFEGSLYPLKMSSRSDPRETHIDLLLYDDHYFLITCLDRLLSHIRGGHRKKFFCHRCLFPLYDEDRLKDHIAHCVSKEPSRIVLPKDKILKFKNWQNCIRAPVIVYADFESYIRPVENMSLQNMAVYQKHEPCSFGMIKVTNCCGIPTNDRVQIYRGSEPVKTFLKKLIQIVTEHNKSLGQNLQHTLSEAEESEFASTKLCHVCKLDLDTDRVRDHCHVCGKFRGAAHNKCNLLLRSKRDIVVVFHNLRRYDGHLIMKDIGGICKMFGLRLDCLAKTLEDYLTFTLIPIKEDGLANEPFEGEINPNEESDEDAYTDQHHTSWRIKFIDSYQFLTSSLDNLVQSMDECNFVLLKNEFNDITLLKRKGVFPYEALSDDTFFAETRLPDRDQFFNRLNNTEISDEDYSHAKCIWSEFLMETMGEYHDLYLKCDVLCLADIFENFRKLCLDNYGLDPAHYITLPSFSMDACYKLTKIELEVLMDPDMYKLFTESVKGGISVASHRYAKANNPYLPEQNTLKPTSYLMYYDVVNLYGTSMKEFYLATDSFRLMHSDEFERIDFLSIPETSPQGYVLVIDLEYPEKYHDDHNDFPLAPEKLKIDYEELSDYCKNLREELGPYTATEKLIPNLRSKVAYALDYRLLQVFCRLGMRPGKIHKVVTFNQSPWLGKYIDLNTNLRKCAKNKFEKDLFKLCNNAIYGKSLENVYGYQDVKLATNDKQVSKLINSPRFKRFSIFTEDLAAIGMQTKTTCLDKPIYLGFTILDLSKLLMYRFHYDIMVKKYGKNLQLCFCDTDSFVYLIHGTDDVYQDMLINIDRYDTSNYPEEHFLYSKKNCKKLGTMTDECAGEPMSEFIALRAKMYSYRLKNDEIKKAKGVKRQVVKENINFADYSESLFKRKVFSHEMNLMRSDKHNIYSVTLCKKSLSPFDDKRYILKDGIRTLAYGHWRIKAGRTEETIKAFATEAPQDGEQ